MSRPENTGTTRVAPEQPVERDVAVPQQRTAPAAPPVREEVVRDQPVGMANRWDRVRWGPIWAGTLTTLAVFTVLQLFFFSLGWLDLGYNNPQSVTVTVIITGLIGLASFFVGGLTTGANVMWRGVKQDGIMHGVVMWALTVVSLIALALVGATGALGTLGTLITGPTLQANTTAQTVDIAQLTAGWTVLFLGLAVLLAALGAGMGTMKAIWSKKEAKSETR